MIFIRDEYYRGSLQKAIEKRHHGDEHGGNNGNREKNKNEILGFHKGNKS